MKERTARSIWKGPEQKEKVVNWTWPADLAMREGAAEQREKEAKRRPRTHMAEIAGLSGEMRSWGRVGVPNWSLVQRHGRK